MAKTRTKNLLFILLVMVIIFPVLLESTSTSKGRILQQHSTAGYESSMMRLHQMKTTVGRWKGASPSKKELNESADREFHAAAHEVPSGPNPESN